MEKKTPIVVGIGELLWDLLPTGKKAGGAPINFVYHASRLGGKGYAISAVGDDKYGEEILAELDKNHIQYLVEKVPYPTGTVQIQLEKGIPEYVITERVAWDHLSPTADAIDLAEKADAICFGTLAQRAKQSRETIQAILSFAPEAAYRLLDINMRQHYYNKELIEESLYLANTLKVNDEELEILKGMFELKGTEETLAKWFLEKYDLRLFVVTAGANYSAIYAKEGFSILPTPKVEVKDTVGAGDSFSGALIISLLRGKSLKEAHKTAVETAAFVCSQEGAWPSYDKEI